MKDEHYQDYTQDFLDRQEKQRKKSVRTAWIVGWTILLFMAAVGGLIIQGINNDLGRPLEHPSWLSGAWGVLVGIYGPRQIRGYIKSRGLDS